MALVRCSGCGKDVSTYDESCANCGCAVRTEVIKSNKAAVSSFSRTVGIVTVLSAVGFAAYIYANKASAEKFALAEQSRVKYGHGFKDPESLQFTGTFIAEHLGTKVLCGYVNAKNGFGAYTGRVRFISGESIQELEMPDTYRWTGEETWVKYCKE